MRDLHQELAKNVFGRKRSFESNPHTLPERTPFNATVSIPTISVDVLNNALENSPNKRVIHTDFGAAADITKICTMSNGQMRMEGVVREGAAGDAFKKLLEKGVAQPISVSIGTRVRRKDLLVRKFEKLQLRGRRRFGKKKRR